MRNDLDITSSTIAEYLVPDQGSIDFDSILIAGRTRDALDEVTARLYRRLFADLTSMLGDVDICDDFNEPFKPYSSFGWRKSKWPEGVKICVEFQRKNLNELCVGVVAPNDKAIAGAHKEGRRVYVAIGESIRDRIHSNASRRSLFGGEPCKITDGWPAVYWLSALARSSTTESLLLLSGAEKYHGLELVEFFRTNIIFLVGIVDDLSPSVPQLN